MDTFNLIKPLPCAGGWYSKTIPAGFDDSVSYLQMLSGILDKQNEIVAQLNINTEFIKNWDKSVENLQAQVDALALKVEHIENEIPDLINTAIVQLKTELLTVIAERFAQIQGYIDTQVARLDERIDNVAIGQITVYDPTTGLMSPIQQVINNLYDSGRDGALTASEFDALQLTATAFDGYQITAYQFDTDGKTILV